MSGSNWIDVAQVIDFDPGTARLVNILGRQIAVVNLGGEFYAFEDKCTHADWPILGSGLDAKDLMEGDAIICSRHGARFCMRTGAALTPPAYEPLVCFPVRVLGGMVQTGLYRPD